MASKPMSAMSNVRWVASSQVGRVGIQLVSITVFARLLPASDFGLLAMATVVTNFANLIRDMGTAAALIQKAELSRELLDTVFWSNVLFGFASCLVISASSPLVALAFNEPALKLLLIVLSLSFPIGSSGTAHLALLERSGSFRSIGIAEVASAVVGAALGIGAALMGAGVWGLVLQTLTYTLLSTCFFWGLSVWRPKFHWSKAEFLSLLPFSGNLLSFNIINYFARNADSMLIGKILGPVELGVYNIGYRIMLFPLNNLTAVISRAMFPVYSRQQNSRTAMAAYLLKAVTLIGAITAPLMFGLWSVRELFVTVVLGQRWLDAAPIIAWLAPTGYLQSLVSALGPILMAIGQTRLLRNLGLISSLICVLSFVAGLSHGAAGVARAYFVASLLISFICFHYTLRQVDLRFIDVVSQAVRPLVCAGIMACAVFTADHFIPGTMGPFLKLLCLVSIEAGVYSIALFFLMPSNFREVFQLLTKQTA
jgi:O-antigen/teichoic acid export membrane protein